MQAGLTRGLLAGSLLLACTQQASAPAAGASQRAWPADTVMAVDDRAILSSEVDLVTTWIARIEPSRSDAHLRRLAACQINIPRAVAAVRFPAERERALAQAKARLQALRDAHVAGPTTEQGALCERAEGGWRELGLTIWGSLMDLPRDEWSEVIEEPGRFLVARTLSRTDGPLPHDTNLVIDACVFPFVPPELTTLELDQRFDEHKLTIVDPAWATVVPELLQYRMRGKDG